MVLVFFLAIGTDVCNAGTYTSKTNPQHSVQYKTVPGIYLTVEQCKNCSQQDYPGTVVRCWTIFSRHFYLNGEVVDDRMDEIAKTPEFQMMDDVLVFIIVVFVFILAGVVFYVYLIPTFVAYKRKHPQRVLIMLLNLFFGNTLVGWIAALIWARSDRGENNNARGHCPKNPLSGAAD